jgi:hypothetical protein
MNSRRHVITLGVLVLGALTTTVACASVRGTGHASDDALTCTAVATSVGGPRTPPVATAVDIVVNRWSSDVQRRHLMDALRLGQRAMLEVLQEQPRVGYIRTPTSLGWDLHYAQASPGEDGGRRVVIATDRRVGFWEAVNRPRSIDYPFTFIELRLNDDGGGEGRLSLATRVIATSDGRFVQLENYAAQPVDLNDVTCS